MGRRRALPRIAAGAALLLAVAGVVAALLLAVAGVVAALLPSHGHGRTSAARQAAPRPARSPGAGARERPRVVAGRHRRPVPILMYHVIAAPLPGVPYPELYTPGRVFAAQMRALHRRGYQAVTLRRVERYWRLGYPLPRRPVVLTFDDGYLGDYSRARPVLRRLGWPGVLNLEVNNARTRGDLSERDVRRLVAAGWEIDSHTVSHPDLTTLTSARLRSELVGSRRWLRSHFGVPASYFCYPSGRFDARVQQAVRRAGYRLATTTQPGLADPRSPFALSRIRVSGADGVAGLLEKLAHPNRVHNGYPGG